MWWHEYLIMLRIICFITAMFFLSCSPKLNSITLDKLDSVTAFEMEAMHNCNEALYYTPDSLTRIKYIRVNVHFMYDDQGQNNFTIEEGRQYMWSLINNANKRLLENEKMNLPPGNDTPVIPAAYQYRLHKNDGMDAYYTHKDSELYYYVNKGKYRNNYNRDIIDKYAIGEDSIINIFVMPHHPDSVATPGYKATGTGIALGTSLKMAGLYDNDAPFWSFATLLNHEVGHILGLGHSWLKYDRCEDTPPHPNCWDNNGAPPCDSLFSNNMMDYNASQMAITPCQLGLIHKGFNKPGSKNRKLVIRDWCDADYNRDIIIDKDTHWQGARDNVHNITVRSGVEFHIYCRLSMAAGTKITLEPGARLYLHDALIHNDCGLSWHGIIVQERKDQKAVVLASDKSRIENIEPEITLD